jgi:N-acetyl-anhydromuramyl-L-alanine amidase AmpD
MPDPAPPAPSATPGIPVAALPFAFRDDWMIPLAPGQAVSRGWLAVHGSRPLGVTWHWGVTRTLSVLSKVIGGANAERKGVASAHYGVGRSFTEGVHRYVSLENRSWHAGRHQTLRWDGKAIGDPDVYRAARCTIGIETSTMGSDGTPGPDWIRTATPLGVPIRVQPWTEEQIRMCIEVGIEIQRRWPHLRPVDHHGHHDLCPVDGAGNAYKVDVCGFPFARVLRGIYPSEPIRDVWTPLETVRQRQRALIALGYPLGATGADGDWGGRSRAALEAFQRAEGRVPNRLWSTFVSRAVCAALERAGKDPAQVTAGPP